MVSREMKELIGRAYAALGQRRDLKGWKIVPTGSDCQDKSTDDLTLFLRGSFGLGNIIVEPIQVLARKCESGNLGLMEEIERKLVRAGLIQPI